MRLGASDEFASIHVWSADTTLGGGRARYLALDIGGTNITAAIVEVQRGPVGSAPMVSVVGLSRTSPLDSFATPQAVIDMLHAALDLGTAEHGPIDGVEVSLGAPVRNGDAVVWPKGLDDRLGTEFFGRLRRQLTIPLQVVNDGEATMLGLVQITRDMRVGDHLALAIVGTGFTVIFARRQPDGRIQVINTEAGRAVAADGRPLDYCVAGIGLQQWGPPGTDAALHASRQAADNMVASIRSLASRFGIEPHRQRYVARGGVVEHSPPHRAGLAAVFSGGEIPLEASALVALPFIGLGLLPTLQAVELPLHAARGEAVPRSPWIL